MPSGVPSECARSWLAGLLEAEGSFLKPPPSSPGCPIVTCRTTDLDVVERVAAAFGVTVQAHQRRPYRTEYAATLKGRNAARLMRVLAPLLGERRNRAIADALAEYEPPERKLSYDAACDIRLRVEGGSPVAAVARDFGVSRQTVHAVLQNRIYRHEPSTAWTHDLPAVLRLPGECSLATRTELSWLAGWLEGEGSFLAPPPRDPRRPRVSGFTRDFDVITRVADILGVTAGRHKDRRSSERGWSPLFRVLCRGSRAIELMRAIEPMMGARRRAQIRRALSAVSQTAPVATLSGQSQGGEIASTWS